MNPFQNIDSHSSTNNPQKPCRVCTDFKSWTHAEKRKGKTHHSPGTSATASTNSTEKQDQDVQTKVKSQTESEGYKMECPPDSRKLGRHTWTFLHTMAAYYPTNPTTEEQSNLHNFLSSFSKLYPCSYCATHLQDYMKRDPPPVNNNWEISQWMCRVHNEVNENLGKPKFDCDKVFERWRDGPKDGSCD
ncbi:augmenter of liver regeneration [Paraphysoderma sedebokerense]|nr:augmenter of liver regeneration [Paraphysoderma sedebokerense]